MELQTMILKTDCGPVLLYNYLQRLYRKAGKSFPDYSDFLEILKHSYDWPHSGSRLDDIWDNPGMHHRVMRDFALEYLPAEDEEVLLVSKRNPLIWHWVLHPKGSEYMHNGYSGWETLASIHNRFWEVYKFDHHGYHRSSFWYLWNSIVVRLLALEKRFSKRNNYA